MAQLGMCTRGGELEPSPLTPHATTEAPGTTYALWLLGLPADIMGKLLSVLANEWWSSMALLRSELAAGAREIPTSLAMSPSPASSIVEKKSENGSSLDAICPSKRFSSARGAQARHKYV